MLRTVHEFKKGQKVQAVLENTAGQADKTVVELLSNVSRAGKAMVRVISDEGNLASAKVGHVLKGFDLDGVMKFEAIS